MDPFLQTEKGKKTGQAKATHRGSVVNGGQDAGRPSLTLGSPLLSVKVDDTGDEAIIGTGAQPRLLFGGGQFPVLHRLGHQAFPRSSLFQGV